MKKIKDWKHEKEFDTKTLITDIDITSEDSSDNEASSGDSSITKKNDKKTQKIIDLKTIFEDDKDASIEEITQVYTPKPLTPEDDIYEDVIEHFASAPTKPKYWFEEFGDYWSCSCGHINKGDMCKSCGLDRELLRTLFILHKPANTPGKLNKKLSKAAKDQIDKEEQHHLDKDNRRKEREKTGDDLTVMPIETDKNSDTSTDKKQADNTAESSKIENQSQPAKNINTASSQESKRENPNLPNKISKPSNKNQKKSGKKLGLKGKIIIAIIACLVLIGGCGSVIYYYMAAPAMKYQDAQQLQESGKYEKAIAKYESLGDYRDSKKMIRECYIGMAELHFENGEYNKAIDVYNIAIDLKDDKTLHDKIWECYCKIGDDYLENKDYEHALSTYYVAADMKDSDELQEKINLAKFRYVDAYQDDRTAKVESYMDDLISIDYPGIQKIYDSYYAWHVKIVANKSETDFSGNLDTFSRKDTVYFHASLSGGEPSEQLMLYYEVTWPNGQTEIYDLNSTWEDGSNITARFQYPIPLFGKEGSLTFKLYDKSSNELLGDKTITFKK